MKLLLSGCYAV